MEYELAALNLLDFWARYSFNQAPKIQFGQYKARYNTERVISSGRLQTAFKKSGFSWQQEFHWKRIYDRLENTSRTLNGNYFQLGTFPVTHIKKFPKQLELAARYAIFYPDLGIEQFKEEEFTFSLNWFFKGHPNKLTAEVGCLGTGRKGHHGTVLILPVMGMPKQVSGGIPMASCIDY